MLYTKRCVEEEKTPRWKSRGFLLAGTAVLRVTALARNATHAASVRGAPGEHALPLQQDAQHPAVKAAVLSQPLKTSNRLPAQMPALLAAGIRRYIKRWRFQQNFSLI